VSEESMKQHFGNYWRGKFTKQNDIGNGFINRTMKAQSRTMRMMY